VLIIWPWEFSVRDIYFLFCCCEGRKTKHGA